MVDNFVTTILRMAETWITEHLIMIAINKIFGDSSVEQSSVNIGLAEAQRQASIGAAAAESAAYAALSGGVVAAIAAAAVAEAALQGITSFAGGGVVTANLHEGEMVLPKNISTFVMTAAASAGGIGGPGGPGGRGGDGGSAGVVHNHLNMTVNHNGGTMDEARLARMVSREMRRRNLT
jgi:uncharacterized membrane protein YgcG